MAAMLFDKLIEHEHTIIIYMRIVAGENSQSEHRTDILFCHFVAFREILHSFVIASFGFDPEFEEQ